MKKHTKTSINDLISSYNSLQEKAIASTPIYSARAFTPLTFSAYNFQTVIRSPDDLWKFADSQQEARASYYCKKISKFSFEELQLIRSVSFLYGNYQKQFDRDFNPVGLNGQLSSIPSKGT